MARASLLLATLILSLCSVPELVEAQSDLPMATQVISVSRSPITIERCRMLTEGFSWQTNIVLGNRTKHGLASAGVTFTAYDPENVKLAQTTMSLPVSDILASADTAPYSMLVAFQGQLTDAKLVSRISCRVASATFTGNRHWAYPQRWPEPPVKLTSDASYSPTNETHTVAATPLSITVSNAWTDVANGTLYIHDAIVVHGGAVDQSLRASNLSLEMRLANGGRRSYPALAQSAPTYQRLNPLGSQTATVDEVDPASDFGRIGQLIVPAHGSVTTTVTFAVGDPVVDKSDDRDVSIR